MSTTSPLGAMTVTGADLPPLAFTHVDPFDPARFVEPRNVLSANGKPEGGLWLSPLVEASGSAISSGWAETAAAVFGGDPLPVQPISLRRDARVLRVDSHVDFEAVTAAFPPPDSGFGGEVDAVTDQMVGRGFDYEAIADQFDAIWLTGRGAAETRHTRPGLNTWDCESVLVLRVEAIDEAVGEAPTAS